MIMTHMQSDRGWWQSWRTGVWWIAEPRQRGLRGTLLRMFAQYPKLPEQLMTGLREYGSSHCYAQSIQAHWIVIANDPGAPLTGNCWSRR